MNIVHTHLCAGRALFIGQDGAIYISRNYEVYRSDDHGRSWQLDCYVPCRGAKSWAANLQLAARLLRFYVAAFQVLHDGTRLAVTRGGIYRAGVGESELRCTFPITRGSRPLNIAVDAHRVLFGEYGHIEASQEVAIYVSEDGGKSFEAGYRFPAGSILHVHNVQLDPYTGDYWVLVGDYGEHPGIASLSRDFRHLEWLARGGQYCRVVQMFVEPDCLIYGMDTDVEQNYIVRMDKKSGKVCRLQAVEGSSLYAASFGPVRVISTTVERNRVTPTRHCSLYSSRDGEDWQRGAIHTKDCYHLALFQFGTLVLPYSQHSEPWGIFSGQAIKRANNQVSFVEFPD